MKKVFVVFGTRPEAIKMCPLVRQLQDRGCFEVKVCVTGQHRQMLDSVLRAFQVEPDYDLQIMQPRQTLFDVTARVLERMRPVLERERPDVVLVQGDTTTAYSAALAAFYMGIPVGHVEAGLRTYDIRNPYPEEMNRRSIDMMSAYHFAPTAAAAENLRREHIPQDGIFVTGNTSIDAMKLTVTDDFTHELLDWAGEDRLVLLTAHRRESLGQPMAYMFRAIRRVVEQTPDVKVLYPVHPNPDVTECARAHLSGVDRVRLADPLDVYEFHNILARSYLVLTDSGGIQEEAPGLGKPVLVMRDVTERPEGVAAGTLRLVGTSETAIYEAFYELLRDRAAYENMSRACNPYGDGNACRRIGDVLEFGTCKQL